MRRVFLVGSGHTKFLYEFLAYVDHMRALFGRQCWSNMWPEKLIIALRFGAKKREGGIKDGDKPR